MKAWPSERKPSLLELLQRQRVRALLATTEPLGLQRSATKSPKPNFNEVRDKRRNNPFVALNKAERVPSFCVRLVDFSYRFLVNIPFLYLYILKTRR